MKRIFSIFLSGIIMAGSVLCVSAQNDVDKKYYSYRESVGSEQATDTVELMPTSNNGKSYEFDIDVPSGNYNIFLNYTVKAVRTDTIKYILKINGECPFAECKNLSAPISYVEESRTFPKDTSGNEISGNLIVSDNAVSAPVCDSEGIFKGNYSFFLGDSSRKLTVEVTDGDIILSSVTLKPAREIPEYAEYNKQNKGIKEGGVIKLNAEHPDNRTSKSIFTFCDASGASVQPVAEDKIVMNALGGSQWSRVGESAEWKIDVPKSGLYELRIKYMQGYTNGRGVSRSFYIDGEVPFKEALNIYFPYSSKWKEMTFSNGKGAYSFYLEKGEHTVALAVSLGDMAEIINDSKTVLSELNTVYRRIITLTGVTPDSYRDYQLEDKIPDVIETIGEEAQRLDAIVERLNKSQKGGTESGVLRRLSRQLKKFNDDPDKIAPQLTQFQSNISAFGTWINDRFTQPLAIDEIALCGKSSKSPFKFVGFFGSIYHGFKQFIYSFSSDYDTSQGEKELIEVWAPTGRDQMQIIKNLTNQLFEPETGISVNLKLIAEAALLPAIVAGEGPDVALMCPQTTPINFAMRNSVEDLTKFDGFDALSAEMIDNSLIPFTYGGGVYAIPETLSFPILFYRTDILAELGIEVPKTWDDVTEMIVDLSHNNMQFGFAGSLQNFATMLYQNNGKVYSDDATASAFNENEAITAFEKYTKLYQYFKIPVTFEFANRFRNGQMPIAVADYMQYNTLRIFASEIDGLWSIAPVPGTMRSDGTINRTVVGTATGCIMIKGTKNKESAWKFMQWWTSADIQEQYGKKVEEKLGASARYAAANAVALEHLPWSYEFYNELSSQIKNVTCIPEVPGGYFTSRHFSNAFRKVIYQNENPRETLLEYTKEINAEITDKRNEFGLTTGGKGH